MLLTTDARGVFPIAPTPFFEDGRIDTASVDRLTDFYLGMLEQRETNFNADFTYELEAGLASPITFAFGGEHRKEAYAIYAGEPASYENGIYGFQTVRHIILPQLGSALLAGALLAFALSFDEVIVTTFTAGQQTTLPIWMLQELIRPRQRPVTNVVAVVIIALTFIPILAAYWLTRAAEPVQR